MHMHTFVSEEYPMNGGAKQHGEVLRLSVLQKIRRCVSLTVGIEYGPTNLSTVDMFVSETVVRRDSDLQQPVSQRRLPLQHRRFVGDDILDPRVRLVDQTWVPPFCPDVVGARTCVEPGVEATPTSEDSCTCVDDAVLGDEPLRSGGGGSVGKCVGERGEVRYVGVAVGRPTSLEEEDGVVLGECGRERAAGRSAADDYVVVVGRHRSCGRLVEECVVRSCMALC